MNSFIKRLDQPAALRQALGTTNAAQPSVVYTDVLSDTPLGAINSMNNGLVEALQAEDAQPVLTPQGSMYYHRAVYVRASSYGTPAAVSMTAAQFDALVNPRGVDIPADFAAQVGITQVVQVQGGVADAFATGLLAGFNPLQAYRPGPTSPGADRLAHTVGSALRMLGLIALVFWALRLARNTLLPLVSSTFRGAFGASNTPRIGARAW